MTLGEFRSWLNGYECSFDLNADGYWPNAKQFTEIKEKLALVDKPPVFTPVPASGGGPFIPKAQQQIAGQLIYNQVCQAKLGSGLCAPATTSGMDNWDTRDIYAPLAGKPI